MLRVRIFWMPKDGHTTSEYEDAYATSEPGSYPFRAAVADGATESAFSGPWARRLTGAYANSGDLSATLAGLRDGFHRISRRGHVPWYLREKSEEGAHAAFAGLEVEGGDAGGTWTGQAVGDCCILHVRDHAFLQSWPLSNPAEFSSTPALISSREMPDEETILRTKGQWQPGDRFILATDALAAWLLGHGSTGAAPGSERAAAATGEFNDAARRMLDGEFEGVVVKARTDGSMRNDDVTAVVIDA